MMMMMMMMILTLKFWNVRKLWKKGPPGSQALLYERGVSKAGEGRQLPFQPPISLSQGFEKFLPRTIARR